MNRPWLMKLMRWTLICECKDGVVVKKCININTTEVECLNPSKMVEQDGYVNM